MKVIFMKLLKQAILTLATVASFGAASAIAEPTLQAIYTGHGSERFLYRETDPMIGLSVRDCSVGASCCNTQTDFQRVHGFDIRDNAHGVQSVR